MMANDAPIYTAPAPFGIRAEDQPVNGDRRGLRGADCPEIKQASAYLREAAELLEKAAQALNLAAFTDALESIAKHSAHLTERLAIMEAEVESRERDNPQIGQFLSAGTVMDLVAECTGIKRVRIEGNQHCREVLEARFLAAIMLRRHTTLSKASIARQLGRRNARTVHDYCRKAQGLRAADPSFAQQWCDIEDAMVAFLQARQKIREAQQQAKDAL